ncbi:MAG: DMT family transporter [Clostridiales bacterium]|nr:DMT family transporter [Clostridiales bacterium]
MKAKYKGILFIILSALCFAFMNMFVRLSGDLPSVQKSFFRNLIAFAIAMAALLRSGERFRVKVGNWRYMILRAAFGTIGILCNFYAVDHLVLSDASMLNKMSPFFVILFSFLILKEKLTPIQVTAVCGAFAGSLLIIKPTFLNMNFLPSLIGLCGGLCAGIAYTMVRMLGQRGQKGTTVVLFFSGFSCLVTLPYLIFAYTPMSISQVLFLLGAGLAAAGGQFAITAAYYHAPAREISVYDYSQIIFSALIGYVVFLQVPDRWSVAGYVIIIAMAIWMFFYNRKKFSAVKFAVRAESHGAGDCSQQKVQTERENVNQRGI